MKLFLLNFKTYSSCITFVMVAKKRQLIKKFKSYIYKVAKYNYSIKTEKRGRPDKYKLGYYIKYITKVLCYGYTWEQLDCECDPSTIKKKFYKWRDNGIFNAAYNLLQEYYADNFDMNNLHIDSTVIANVNCNECIGYSYKFKGKKSTKINTIVTNDKITVSHIISKPSEHDVNFIEPCLEQVIDKVNPTYHQPLYVTGDKGYTTTEIKDKLKQKNIILIYPHKKNTVKKKINYKHKKKLSDRFNVEVSYAYTKKRYKRIKLPTDKKIKNYNVFYILSNIFDILIFLIKRRSFSKLNRYVDEKIQENNIKFNYDPDIHIAY